MRLTVLRNRPKRVVVPVQQSKGQEIRIYGEKYNDKLTVKAKSQNSPKKLARSITQGSPNLTVALAKIEGFEVEASYNQSYFEREFSQS